MHVAFSDQPVEIAVDAVVVGSGAGGAVAAATLARAGWTVALVEAGPWRSPEDYPTSSYGTMRDLFEDWGSTITRGRAFWPIVQARVVGGTTVINSAICVRTPADIFEKWRREHGVDGLDQAVMRSQDQLEKELSVDVTPPESMRMNNLLAFRGAEKLGYDGHAMRRFVKGCEGSARCMSGCRKLRKQSTNVVYVPELLERGGTLLSNAPVKRVLFEGDTAVGVTGWFRHPQTRAWGAKYTVRARKAVIVAASATHSPAILQRSGVRLPALGEHFRAHPGTGLFALYDEIVDMNEGATQGWASTAFRESPGFKLESLSLPMELVPSRLYGAGSGLMERMAKFRHLAMWCHAVRAESVGTVKNGWFDKPVVSYTLDRADMERFRTAMATLARTHFAAGARKVLPGIVGLPPEIDADQVGLIEQATLDPRAYFAVLSHLFGGCVMGTDERRSVVDTHGRVHGKKNLLVADASVIPTNLGVNPQHTIMALAQVFSERLAS
jgi:choline dehydrogenase-like flavoprotein